MLWAIFIVGGFLAGSLMFSRWIPLLFQKRDVAMMSEDKNPGAFNAFRFCGAPIGMLCLIFDLAKGAIPAYLAARWLDVFDLRFALVMAAPVLGHAIAPLSAFKGKCISVSFGVLIGLIPTSWFGFILAGIFFLLMFVVKIRPHSRLSIFSFLLFFLLSAPVELLLYRRFAIWIGAVLMSTIAVIRHIPTYKREMADLRAARREEQAEAEKAGVTEQ